MWKAILSLVPWEKVIPWLVSKLAGVSDRYVQRLLDKALELVIQVEEEYGDGKGREKFEEVRQRLKKAYGDAKGWVVNLIIELAVGVAKKKGLIR